MEHSTDHNLINCAIEDAIETDGFFVVDRCLSDSQLCRLDAVFPPESRSMRELLASAEVRELARSQSVRQLAEPILGRDAFAVSGTYFNKTRDANWKVPWHQDRMIKVERRCDAAQWGPWSTKGGVEHVQPPPEVMSRLLAIRIHLDDCDESNGALRVIGGSHRDGYLSAQEMESLPTGGVTLCPVRRGGAMLMRPLLLHASRSGVSASRRVIHLEFAAEALPGPLEWRYRVGS